MTSCWACETELRPEWRFCIHCGVPVETDAELAAKRDRSPAPLALFGWIFASIAGALLITVLIMVVVVR